MTSHSLDKPSQERWVRAVVDCFWPKLLANKSNCQSASRSQTLLTSPLGLIEMAGLEGKGENGRTAVQIELARYF